MAKQKKVSRPRKLQIGDKEYKVVSRTYKSWRKSKRQRHKTYGQITYDKGLIEVNKYQNSEEMVDTCLHELSHGVIREYTTNIDGRKEEKFVTDYSSGFTDALKKNIPLLEWILQELKKEVK